MKKAVSLFLALLMLCAAFPTSALALNEYVVYNAQEGCQLTDLTFTQADNAWLLWDVTFEENSTGLILTTTADHPNLIGCKVVPSISFEGTSVTFNGTEIAAGDAVVLEEKNELVVIDKDNHCRAEYTVVITEETNGLPVVLIDTDNVEIATKLEYVDASISVLGADVYDGKDIYSAVAGIKLRGNSTMGYAKKPYRIKFDKKQDVLDMGKAKSWVLLADYLDPSSMRNQVAFNLANNINDFTAQTTGFDVFSPRMKMVEVYLNGEFKGLYEMGDHMQANELRVAINELGDEEDETTGEKLYNVGEEIGYFVEVEVESRVLTEGAEGYEDWSAYSYIENVGASSDSQNQKLYFQFKLPEAPSTEQSAYITDYMQTINDLILANDDAVWDYLDMNSVINWYLVNEIFKNADSQMQSSVYFFKDGTLDEDGNAKENPDTKMYMAPVWDFDLGAGGVAYGDMNDPTGWRTRNDEYCGWFRELFNTETFSNAVNTRWAELHEEGILDAMYTDIDALNALIGDAAAENFAQWHDTYLSEIDGTWMTVPEVSEVGDWAASVDYLETYLKTRVAWMDEQFGYSEATVNETVTEDAVLFDNEVFTAASAGTVSKTYTVDQLIDLDMLAFDLDITTTAAFDLGFDLRVACNINGESVVINLTPSAKNDWTGSGNIFNGTTGEYIAAGTYNDRVMTVSGALKWNLWANYRTTMEADGFTAYNQITLEDYVTAIRLNSITVTLDGAVAGDTATFTLKNVDADGNPAQVTKTVIGGKPTIMGDAKVGSTLVVSDTSITPYGAGVAYQWYVDGVAVDGATDTTYTVATADLGKAITVKATGVLYYTGSVTSDAVTAAVAENTDAAPAAPTFVAATTDSITVEAVSGYEYSLDGTVWQTSGEFTGLNVATVYNVYCRKAATDTASAGAVSEPLYAVTSVWGGILGDVDADGKLETADAVWILDQALGFIDMNDCIVELADFNQDGRVSTSDARRVLKAIVSQV